MREKSKLGTFNYVGKVLVYCDVDSTSQTNYNNLFEKYKLNMWNVENNVKIIDYSNFFYYN